MRPTAGLAWHMREGVGEWPGARGDMLENATPENESHSGVTPGRGMTVFIIGKVEQPLEVPWGKWK